MKRDKYKDLPANDVSLQIEGSGLRPLMPFLVGAATAAAALFAYKTYTGLSDQTTALYIAGFAVFCFSAVLLFTNYEAGERLRHRRSQTLARLKFIRSHSAGTSERIRELADELEKRDGRS